MPELVLNDKEGLKESTKETFDSVIQPEQAVW